MDNNNLNEQITSHESQYAIQDLERPSWSRGRRDVESVNYREHSNTRRRHQNTLFNDDSRSSDDEEERLLEVPHSFPPLPQQIIRRIRSGKFVDFDYLLPHSTAPGKSHGDALLMVASNDGFRLTPKSKNKAKVFDFFSWSQAWAIFMMYYLYFNPHRLQEILGYYQRAVEFASRYIFEDFEAYDIQFRHAMAGSRSRRWDKLDDNLKARYLLQTKPVCVGCRNFGHRFMDCPVEAKNNKDAARNKRDFSFSEPPRDLRTMYCRTFNSPYSGSCPQNCRFMHKCNICGGGNHSAVHCKNRK